MKQDPQPRQEQQAHEFPRNSRFITDILAYSSTFREYVFSFLHVLRSYIQTYVLLLHQFLVRHKLQVLLTLWFFALVIGLFGAGRNVLRNIEEKERIDTQRKMVQEEINYWEKVVSRYKGYRDGYFQLALLEYQLGNREKAAAYVKQALFLDPNFAPAQELQAILQK